MCCVMGYKVQAGGDRDLAFKFFEALMIEGQIRGKHATGVSWVGNSKVRATRSPISASEFVKTEVWKKLKQAAPTEMIGHCRYSTSGDHHNNLNNQPIISPSMSLVHNGLISMASKAEYDKLYDVETETENDSEILLRKVNDAWTQNAGEAAHGEFCNIDAINQAFCDVYRVATPIFACAFLDVDRSITIVHDHLRPLWRFSFPEEGIEGFASTEDIIRRAIARAGMKGYLGSIQTVYPYTFETFTEMGVSTYPMTLPAIIEKINMNRETVYPPQNMVDRRWLDNRATTLNKVRLTLDEPDYEQGDHRTNLRESFKRYSAMAVKSWEIDPNYPLMAYLFKRFELSMSQRYWACFLYGVFYHPGTVFYVMQEFPEFEKVDLGRLKRWHSDNWQSLHYNKDRKYEKGHFVEMYESYLALIGYQTSDAQETFFAKLLDPRSPTKSFHNVTKALNKLLRFGRYSVYIYTEALARSLGLPIEADTVFLKEARSPRAGLAYILGQPEKVKCPLTPDEWLEYEGQIGDLMYEIGTEYGVTVDHWLLESCLCAFKGFFANGRYLGYYLDRMADEIIQMAGEDISEGVDWRVLWQFRYECMPWEYLGELVRPMRLKVVTGWRKHFVQTGQMIGMAPALRRGLLPRTKVGK